MTTIYPIHNDKEHQQALARLAQLLEEDPAADTDAAAELEVLATLVEKYETEHFAIAPPTPLEAIRFRMDQMGLMNKDLVPYIGSASKVSEVLNGKRPLSLNMIRNLHRHLNIPAEVLIQDGNSPLLSRTVNADGAASAESIDGPKSTENADQADPEDFPLRDMHKRGYFPAAPASWIEAKKQADDLLDKFLRRTGIRETSPAYCRSTAHYRQTKDINNAALLAWRGRVLIRSRERKTGLYDAAAIDDLFFDRIATLSVFVEGPRLARELIEQQGIAVVVEKHLPKTYLDGAALLRDDGTPVIGLTLRHDKLDNFWFTLLHELVHVRLHLSNEREAIFDDLSQGESLDAIEREADRNAGEVLIPTAAWRRARVRKSRSPEDALDLARSLNRHPAIIVGRLQKEANDYSLLARSVGIGRNRVRKQFADYQ